jgi:hypothetical protein
MEGTSADAIGRSHVLAERPVDGCAMADAVHGFDAARRTGELLWLRGCRSAG